MTDKTIRIGSKVRPNAAKGVWTVEQIDIASNSALCTAATFGYWFDLSTLKLVNR